MALSKANSRPILLSVVVLFLALQLWGCSDGNMFPVRTASGTNDTSFNSGVDTNSDTGSDTDTATDSDTGTDLVILCDTDAVLVNSLEELLPTLSQNDMNIRLAPGTYRITPDDVSSGLFSGPILLNVTASNSTYCFSGAYLEIETEVLQSFGNVEVVEMGIYGANNVIQHLTIEDIGDSRPGKTAVGIMIDGSSNVVDGLHLTVRGSEPYGYGNIFGDGAGYIIQHFKHLAIVIHGDDQQIKDSMVIHRAYGHGIYVAGAHRTLIENCYVEGEVRSTDDILAEAGTGSPADNVDFMTQWGYPVPPGLMTSLQRGGIYAANMGTSVVTGDERHTENIRVIGCTIKNMGMGVNIEFVNDEKYVENCEAVGCIEGFSVGTQGQILESRGNAVNGPLFVNDYQSDNGSVVDLTVLDNSDLNGNDTLAYIGGTGHDITFRNSEASPPQSLVIKVSGLRGGLRHYEVDTDYDDFTSDAVTINNLTNYPLILAEKSSNCTGQSGGPVTDNGTENSITSVDIK